MTGTNVSNLLDSFSSEKSFEIPVKQKSSFSDVSFKNTLVAFSNVSKNESPRPVDNTIEKKTTEEIDSSINCFTTKSIDSKGETIAEEDLVNAEAENFVDLEEFAEEIEDFSQEIMSYLKDAFEISEDELTSAMEVLGLTAVELVLPQNLAAIVTEINPEIENVELLMSSDFNEILSQMNDLAANLEEQLGISLEEFSNNIGNFSVMEEQVIDFQNLNHSEIIENSNQVFMESENPISEEMVDGKQIIEGEEPEIKDLDTKTEKVKLDEVLENEDLSAVEKTVEKDLSNAFEKKEQNSNFEFDKESKSAVQLTKNDGEMKTKEFDFQNTFSLNQMADEKITYSPFDDTVSLPTGQTVRVSEMVDQIVEQARITNFEDQTTMEMTLNPEGLGKIYMEVTQHGNEITAKIFTENEVVKEALENQMVNLRTNLNEGSQKITSVEVAVGSHEFEKNLEENARQEQQNHENANQQTQKNRRINLNILNELDGLSKMMTEEEQLVAQIMKDNGNSLDFQA